MTRVLDTIEAGFNRLFEFLAAAVAVSLGLMTLLISLNLLLMRMQMTSLGWLNEAIEYALYTGVFLAAPWVLQQGAHVRVDVVLSMLPRRATIVMERVLDVLGALLSAFLCFYGTRSTIWEYVDGALPNKDLKIANWIMMAVFAFAFFLMTVGFLLRLRRSAGIVDAEINNPMKASL